MRIAITGSTGFIGSRLTGSLQADGHDLIRLVRQPRQSPGREVRWDPENDLLDRSELAGVEGVVHLAGESIVGMWTEKKKDAIRRSRIRTTRFLSEVLASLEQPPRVLACASAVGYYGSRGAEILTEESPPGDDFLAAVCREWEEATETAADAGIRVVNLRFGVVLDPSGGVLQSMAAPFKLGLGGRLGDGTQYMSWITLDDAVEAVRLVLRRDSLRGPVNVVSPTPVTNAEFTRTLARVLSRPAFLPLPKPLLTAALGDMARQMLLASQRVSPRKLTENEFRYLDPELEPALRRLYKRA